MGAIVLPRSALMGKMNEKQGRKGDGSSIGEIRSGASRQKGSECNCITFKVSIIIQ
jgi:hypothetical protein